MATEYPLTLTIRALDKATAPLRALNARMAALTAPVRKLNNSFRALSAEAGLPRLAKSMRGVGAAVWGVGGEVLKLGAKLGALASVAGWALWSITKSAVDAGDKLSEMAQRVGLSVDAYAQLQGSAAQADVEQEQFNSAMDQFNKRLGMAKAGSGELLTFLKKVSPALALQVQGAKSTEEALDLMVGAFEKLKDPAKIAALSGAAFGKAGLQMGQWAHQGRAAIGEQRQRIADVIGSQKKFADGASDLDNAMKETGLAFVGVRNAALGELSPALKKLSLALKDFLLANREGIVKWAKKTGDSISAWVDGGGIDRLTTSLKDLATSISGVIDKLGGLKGVLAVMGVVMAGPVLTSTLNLGAAFWKLGAAMLPVMVRGLVLGLTTLPTLATGFMAATAAALPLVAAVAAIATAMGVIYKYRDVLHPEIETDSYYGRKFFPDGERRILGANGQLLKVPKAQSSEAHVTVDFNGLPKGVRAAVAPDSSAPLDLNLGYSMGGG